MIKLIIDAFEYTSAKQLHITTYFH